MEREISFYDFLAKVNMEFAKNGIAVPEDIDMLELAHMECLAEEASADHFIQKMVNQYKRKPD